MADDTLKSYSMFDCLNVLVGEWEMEVSVGGVSLARAKTDFKWFEGGAFLIQHSVAEPPLPTTPQIWIDNNPNPIVVVIGYDDFSQKFYSVYTDVRGVRRVYQMSLEDKVWKFWGQAGSKFFQRFEGKISDNGNIINANVERSPDDKNWELDFNATYIRTND